MLKRIRLVDFKSFRDEEIELAPLTFLVGANASGKSNFLDAIRFLFGLSLDLTLTEVLNGEESARPDAWPGIRGRAEEVARLGTSEFTIESTWLVDHDVIDHRIGCRVGRGPKVQSESLSQPGQEPFVRADSKLSVVSTRRVLDPPSVSLLLDAYRSVLRKIRFPDIRPAVMRDYGRRGAPLGDEGKNVSGVLADLSSDPEERESLVAWLRELCAPELDGLDFIEVKELGDVMAVLVEQGDRRISARSLSDGTLRFLGLLLALRTAEPGSVILIEGVEAEFHPTRIRLLVEYLEAVARERRVQVIATTHSPVVLQWLSDEVLRNAIVFGRVPEHKGTIARRLGDLPYFVETVERAGIDELFTTGWLEMAL